MGCMGTQGYGDFCGRDIDSTSAAKCNDRGAHPGNVTAYRQRNTMLGIAKVIALLQPALVMGT